MSLRADSRFRNGISGEEGDIEDEGESEEILHLVDDEVNGVQDEELDVDGEDQVEDLEEGKLVEDAEMVRLLCSCMGICSMWCMMAWQRKHDVNAVCLCILLIV